METVKRLKAAKHLDPETGSLFRIVKNEGERFVLHCHEYYEVFLITENKGIHFINGSQETVSLGYLCFIRKEDIHNFSTAYGKFGLVNLAFSEETFDAMVDFLGDAIPWKRLLTAEFPPSVTLSGNETSKLRYKMTEINTIDFNDKPRLKLKTRMVLSYIFDKYFSDIKDKISDIPYWLEYTYEKMQKPENFIAGRQRMLEISGVSKEYLSRCMRKYYDITPSEYLTELRLQYAANMLLAGELNATEVCYESGFQNISWFYSIFQNKYGCTPAKFKSNHKKHLP